MAFSIFMTLYCIGMILIPTWIAIILKERFNCFYKIDIFLLHMVLILVYLLTTFWCVMPMQSFCKFFFK